MPRTASAAPPPLSHADLKAALSEVLRENREFLRDLVQEALEDAARDEFRREAEYRAARMNPHLAMPAAEGLA